MERRAAILESNAPGAIEAAADRIAAGDLVALPTDTVYGIATSLAHPESLRRIITAKGRPDGRPLPVLVSSTEMIPHLTTTVPDDVALLLDLFWPGPLTAVLPAKPGMPPEVTGEGQTIGLRLPNHPLAIEVIARAGGAVACTSANRSGHTPACSAADVADQIGRQIDLILDGGHSPGGVASTVVKFDGDVLIVLREGPVGAEQLAAAWAELLAGRG